MDMVNPELIFGKVITKSGKVIYIERGELLDDKEHFKVVSISGLKFIIPIIRDSIRINCVFRRYNCPETSSFLELFIYNQ